MSIIMMHRKHMSSSVPVHVTRHRILSNTSNYHLDLVKHPDNVYAVHLYIDSHNLYGYCTGYLSMPLDTWTHFVSAVIPKVNFPRYDVLTIFTSSVLLLVT